MVRLDHPNPKDVEENDIKFNFMEKIETFKEEMKGSLKEMEGKTMLKQGTAYSSQYHIPYTDSNPNFPSDW